MTQKYFLVADETPRWRPKAKVIGSNGGTILRQRKFKTLLLRGRLLLPVWPGGNQRGSGPLPDFCRRGERLVNSTLVSRNDAIGGPPPSRRFTVLDVGEVSLHLRVWFPKQGTI